MTSHMSTTMLLFLLAAAAGQPTPEPAAKPSPIRKVVTLIEDMKTQVEKEGEEDKAAYDKYACWCETNDKEKTDAIEAAEKAIEDLSAKIEEYAALQAQLKTEIEKLEFEAQEADLKEALSALKQALDVLGKVQLMQ